MWVCFYLCCHGFRAIIQYVKDPEQPYWQGYVYAFVILVVSQLQTAVLNQYFLKAMLIGMRLRSTMCASVYNKVPIDVEVHNPLSICVMDIHFMGSL